ncbi:MAG: type IV pilin [Halanaeroarchaeum sp.]
MAGSDRGTSETLGAVLLTVVVVTAVSVAGGAVFLADAPPERPQASFDATVGNGTLTVVHVGGEPLDGDATRVVIDAAGDSVALKTRSIRASTGTGTSNRASGGDSRSTTDRRA